MPEGGRPATPASIFVAIGLIAFAFASPFIGSFISDLVPHDSTRILGVFFEFVLLGTVAGALGIAATAHGARRGPRSWLTVLAIVLATLFCVAVAGVFIWLRQ